MEGPYRDLGSGFVRLTGIEGVRRSPTRITYVEDALFELLRNAADAGAGNIYVSSSLKARRYRTLTVLDDGLGIPEAYGDLIFEPGVTNRHLESSSEAGGLSLYHLKRVALSAAVLSTAHPTSIQVTFDTQILPERAVQSDARIAGSNLPSTIRTFLQTAHPAKPPNVYYGSPATILTTLIQNHIIPPKDSKELREMGDELGLAVSMRTAQRIRRREVGPVDAISIGNRDEDELEENKRPESRDLSSGARLELGQEEISRIAAILGEAARTRYLEVGKLEFESRPGELVVRSRVYEPEEEYE